MKDNSKINLLRLKQNYPLEMKIKLTEKAMDDFIDMYGIDGVYIPYSGGKDSSVLLDIAYKRYGNSIPAIFSNTKNEFISIINQVEEVGSWYQNLEVVRSPKNIQDVIETLGYPVVSKKISRMLRDLQNPTDKNAASRHLYLTGEKRDGSISSHFKLPKKYFYLLDADFKISPECCTELKKKPMHEYEKATGRKPIIATMAHESSTRLQSYLKTGCNNFSKGSSTPMGPWLENDVLEYIVTRKVKIPTVYGEIKQDHNCNLCLTGEQRTGCVACILGLENERKSPKNRLQRLKEIEPKKYEYVIERLNFKKVLDFMKYKY